MAELATVRGKIGLPIERDKFFTAKKTLGEYAEDARETSFLPPTAPGPCEIDDASGPMH